MSLGYRWQAEYISETLKKAEHWRRAIGKCEECGYEWVMAANYLSPHRDCIPDDLKDEYLTEVSKKKEYYANTVECIKDILSTISLPLYLQAALLPVIEAYNGILEEGHSESYYHHCTEPFYKIAAVCFFINKFFPDFSWEENLAAAYKFSENHIMEVDDRDFAILHDAYVRLMEESLDEERSLKYQYNVDALHWALDEFYFDCEEEANGGGYKYCQAIKEYNIRLLFDDPDDMYIALDVQVYGQKSYYFVGPHNPDAERQRWEQYQDYMMENFHGHVRQPFRGDK